MLSEMAHYHLILTLTVLSLMRQYLFPISTSLLLAVNGSVIFYNYSTVCHKDRISALLSTVISALLFVNII